MASEVRGGSSGGSWGSHLNDVLLKTSLGVGFEKTNRNAEEKKQPGIGGEDQGCGRKPKMKRSKKRGKATTQVQEPWLN